MYLAIVAAMWALTACSGNPAVNYPNTVNPIIGDESFIRTFGFAPDAHTDEHLRVSTHLAYAEQLLRNKDVSHLSPANREQRNHLLDLLAEYRTEGIFPVNYDHPDARKPCFIDKDQRICAVGYLLEQTAGRAAAEAINAKHQYEELLAMNDPMLDSWITTTGLTREELATIQPQYVFPVSTYNHFNTGESLITALGSGTNAFIAIQNNNQIKSKSTRKLLPAVGISTGLLQVGFGAILFGNTDYGRDFYGQPIYNETQRGMGLLNMGIGTTTTLLSAWNLLDNRSIRLQSQKVTWNAGNFSLSSGQVAMGLGMMHRF